MTKQRLLIGILCLFQFASFGQIDSLCSIKPPILSAEVITCIHPSVQIHAAAHHPNLEMAWFKQSGEHIGTIAPNINESGWYYVTTKLHGTHCKRIDSIFVQENKEKPVAIANFHLYSYANLCSYGLDGHGSSTGSDFLYFWWADLNDVPIENETSLQASTKVPSRYFLTVTDRINGCSATAELNLQVRNQGVFIEK